MLRSLADVLLRSVEGRTEGPGVRSPLAQPGWLLHPPGNRCTTRPLASLGTAEGVSRRGRLPAGDAVPGRVARALAAGGGRVHDGAAEGTRATGHWPDWHRPEESRSASTPRSSARRGGCWAASSGSMPRNEQTRRRARKAAPARTGQRRPALGARPSLAPALLCTGPLNVVVSPRAAEL